MKPKYLIWYRDMTIFWKIGYDTLTKIDKIFYVQNIGKEKGIDYFLLIHNFGNRNLQRYLWS